MKKALCFLFMFLSIPCATFAGQTGDVGVGFTAGTVWGPTLKYWFDEKAALNLGIGLNHDGIFYADYLWHGWDLPTQSREGRAAFYTGLGARFENVEDTENKVGVRIPLGLNYLLRRHPLELFAEVAPVVQFSPDSDLKLDAGLGARFYFSTGR